MSAVCPQSRLWLYQTVKWWLKTTSRQASTTSAINRGIRATQDFETGGRRRESVRRPIYGHTQLSAEEKRGGQRRTRSYGQADELVNEEKPLRGRDRSIKIPAERSTVPSVLRRTQHEEGLTLGLPLNAISRYQLLHGVPPNATLDRICTLLSAIQAGHQASIPGDDPDQHLYELRQLLRQINAWLWKDSTREDAVREYLVKRGARQAGLFYQEWSVDRSNTVLYLKPGGNYIQLVVRKDERDEGSGPRAISYGQLPAKLSYLHGLMRDLQREEGNSTAIPRRLISEARAIVEQINASVKVGVFTPSNIRRGLKLNLGRPGYVWDSQLPDRKQSRILYREDQPNVLELVLKDGIDVSSRDLKTEAETHVATSSPVQPILRPKKAYSEDFAVGVGIGVEPEADEDIKPARSGRDRKPEIYRTVAPPDMPLSIPYTTAASVFLYGSNAVLAALRARRRKLYQLYIHARSEARGIEHVHEIRKLAAAAGITIQKEPNLALLDKMSGDRPHNGIVLEASRLPTPPVLSLRMPDQKTAIIPLDLARQNAEEVAVNGAPEALPTISQSWRQPFVVLLDGIRDEGNLGNIIRTCHFFGVDAVAVATNTCAPLNSSIVAKASSGACEAMRILALPKPSDFVYQSSKAGWKVFASVAPGDQYVRSINAANVRHRHRTTDDLPQSLIDEPCMLLLGAEDEGLRENLKQRADYFVSIDAGERESSLPEVGVDSVNVAVAAGVLIESFMRRPKNVMTKAESSQVEQNTEYGSMLRLESDLGFCDTSATCMSRVPSLKSWRPYSQR